MSMVTTEWATWGPHSHRHHAASEVALVGPEGPSNVTGSDPLSAPPSIGGAQFLFWSVAGADGGDTTYPHGDLTPSPSFPTGTDPGSATAWYIQTGGNGQGPPGLIFDAFLETTGSWIDWDSTNDPFTVTQGTRGAPPDDDDEAYTEGGDAIVDADDAFPGSGYIFDKWLLIGDSAQLFGSGPRQVTERQGTRGVAIAVYRESKVRVNRVAGPVWWRDEGDPASRVRQYLQHETELGQIASLIDFSSVISDTTTRARLQQGMYESLISSAQRQLNELKGAAGSG